MTADRHLIHRKIFDIAWGDMDALGHVNNARYFEYFQEARIEWLRTLDFNLVGQTGPVVIHVACTYLKPVIYPATVELQTFASQIGNSSVIIEHDLLQNNTVMAQGTSKIVWIDYVKQKSVPLPESIRKLKID